MEKKTLWQAVKYLLFSVSAGLEQAGVFALLTYVVFRGQDQLFWLCNLIALVCSVLWNFTLNRKYTFQSANNVPIAMLKVAAFYVVFTPLSTWAGNWLCGIGWNEYLVLILSMLSNFVLEFLYQRFFVFGASIDTAVKK